MSVPPCGISRGATLIGVEGAFLFLCYLVVGLRLYVRVRIVRETGLDDLAMVIALILASVTFGIDVGEVHYGLGQHVNCLPYDNVVMMSKLLDISTVVILLSLMFSRLSICLFLLRLFSVNRNWRILLYILMGLIFATNVASAAIILPQCEPRDKLWNPEISGSCWPFSTQLAVNYFNGAVSAASDLVLSILPTYFLWKVQIKLSLKIAISIIMGLGVFTAACAIVRTVLEKNSRGSDISWDAVTLTIWAVMESDIAIIAGSIPALWPLVSRTQFGTRVKSIAKRYLLSSFTKSSQSSGIKRNVNKNNMDKRPGAWATANTESTRSLTREERYQMENRPGVLRNVEVEVGTELKSREERTQLDAVVSMSFDRSERHDYESLR